MSALDLDGDISGSAKLRRVNRLPIIAIVVLIVVFTVVVVWGLSGRGVGTGDNSKTIAPGQPASDLADALTEGVRPGIVETPRQDPADLEMPQVLEQPSPPRSNPFAPALDLQSGPSVEQIELSQPDGEQGWEDRLARELEEVELREEHRQRLASLQAQQTAASSPLAIDLSAIEERQSATHSPTSSRPLALGASSQDRLGTLSDTIRASLGEQSRGVSNGYGTNDLGSEPRGDDGQGGVSDRAASPYALRRGSVIPATLISAIHSDLPGHISAQVRQNVYDTATGHHLLIPQGSRLMGRYEADVDFGQTRLFVTWSDLILPDGSTLGLGDLSGMDVVGRGGFSDRVDNRYLETFGAAALVALIGTGVDLAAPRSYTNGTLDPWAIGQSNLAESMARTAEQTISRGLDVSPTLEIRAGYRFNVFVERDIVFSSPYHLQ